MSATKQAIDEIVNQARARIAEHADSVLILATFRNEEGAAVAASYTCGNFYANRGAAEEWLDEQRARINNFVSEKKDDNKD
jgi:hypothetical protein